MALWRGFFEQQLIDYDVSSNDGNWQYIAGVGSDPRGGRYFNLEKQAAQYDPDGLFTTKWGGFRPASQSMSLMALTGPSRTLPDGPPEKIRFAQQNLSCLRASVQLARGGNQWENILLLKTL